MTILLYSVLGKDSAGILPVLVWLISLQMKKAKRRAAQMSRDLENVT